MVAISYKNHHKYFILLIISILTGCNLQNKVPNDTNYVAQQIRGHWYKTSLFPIIDPMVLKFDSVNHYESFNFRHGKKRSVYRIEKDQLITSIHRFNIHLMTADSLILSYVDDPQQRKISYSSNDPEKVKSPEKNIYMLLPALTAPTVESRVRNLVRCFKNGDYITTEMLFFLTGIDPFPQVNEREDVPIQRNIVGSIHSIQKMENDFMIHFKNQEDIRTKFPIYENKSFNARKKVVLDLVIKSDAKAKIIPHKNGVRINIDGIKVGKGFLKVNIPTFTIQGNTGKLLGIRFSLVKK